MSYNQHVMVAALGEVLTRVRVTGQSAHHQEIPGAISPLVRAVARDYDLSAILLQEIVERWADNLQKLELVRSEVLHALGAR